MSKQIFEPEKLVEEFNTKGEVYLPYEDKYDRKDLEYSLKKLFRSLGTPIQFKHDDTLGVLRVAK